jgi:hypothetical protein
LAFASALGIPRDFIVVSATTFFASLVGSIGLVWLVIIVFRIHYLHRQKGMAAFASVIWQHAIFLIILAILSWLFIDNLFGMMIMLGIHTVIHLIPDFVIPIWSKRFHGVYHERVVATSQESMNNEPDIFGLKHLPRPHFYLLVIVLLMIVFAGGVGHREAANQRDYFVIKGPVDRVILRKYNDFFVTVNFNTSTQSLGLTYQLLPISEAPLLTKERIGILRAVVLQR